MRHTKSDDGRASVEVIRVPGLVPYETGLEWQRNLGRARIERRLESDLLLLLEHEPVLTVGRGVSQAAALDAPPDASGDRVPSVGGDASVGEAKDAGRIPRFEIERGGDLTYHGPGQLVGYPILDLRGFREDLHWYVRTLEEALILALARFGAWGFRVSGHTGVWVGDGSGLDAVGRPEAGSGQPEAGSTKPEAESERPEAESGLPEADFVRQRIASGALRKIASIGVHVSRWVTWHGFALNVTDAALGPFAAIVPCGIPGVHMTSLASEGVGVSWERVLLAVEGGFGRAFGVRVEEADAAQLEGLAAGLAAAAGSEHG